ncbi:phytanoyl-CoA dioxygenase family protein [Sphingomonas sp. SM33]|uniref:Phytanoyl-CoA dioxygenase family protein n=1 Tax=Sphingomonas telluris TaxID=2907998 RepID=A0ABS9VRT2_9SPHN|nr:phytanoyl-CoA dioxygenase family protein [Sphingomonas telluris]MCH8617312.1 phytanoyl-CoA dioxygenase family protein [Sphingomonas telluris]
MAAWLATGPVAANVRDILGEMAQPVRAILFDKTHEANWALPWHQDRTIAVRQRVETEGFLNWNTKSGAVHVEPPFNFIENMLTARIHLDPVPETNAPLLIAPGSHRLGRIPEGNIERVAEQCGSFACVANAGDVWLYRTAILHASDAVRQPGRRRVLQVDYAAEELPGELRWLGVG